MISHRFSTLLLFTAAASFGQSGKAPSVSMAPVATVTAQRAAQTLVNLNFRVASGFHINSNTPKSEFLIPTALKMDLPTDIVLGKIDYPDGQGPDVSLFARRSTQRLHRRFHDHGRPCIRCTRSTPGKYVMHGVLRYQACDNAQCFPPKTVPVSFEVKVVKEPPGPRHNPAQSPHVHN